MKRFIGIDPGRGSDRRLRRREPGSQRQRARRSQPVGVELTYTKWFAPTFPNMVGDVGGDIVGKFGGAVLERTVAPDGLSAHLTAVYIVISPDPAQTFTAHIEGTSDLQTGNAVLDGRVVDGWLKRAHVHVEFKTINCTQAPNGKCFQGTISVTRSSRTPGTNATSRALNSAGRPRQTPSPGRWPSHARRTTARTVEAHHSRPACAVGIPSLLSSTAMTNASPEGGAL